MILLNLYYDILNGTKDNTMDYYYIVNDDITIEDIDDKIHEVFDFAELCPVKIVTKSCYIWDIKNSYSSICAKLYEFSSF